MRPFLLPAILLRMLLIASMSMAAEPASQETKAIAVIEQYGGKVRFDWKRPDRPVVFVEIENANFDDTALARLSARVGGPGASSPLLRDDPCGAEHLGP